MRNFLMLRTFSMLREFNKPKNFGGNAVGGGGGSVDVYYTHPWRRRRKLGQT